MTNRIVESSQAIETLYRLVGTDPRAAISLLEQHEERLASEIYFAAFGPGVLIDAGSSLKDPSVIKKGVDSLAKLLDSGDPRISAWHRALFFNLGNGYSTLAALERRSDHDPDRQLLQQTKHAYESALAAEIGQGGRQLEAELRTNYGNALSACGRHYEALLEYDKAVRVAPNHSMAMGNKGIELEHYAYLARNQSGLLLAEAYELCELASEDECLDSRGLASARATFAAHRDQLQPVYLDWRERLQSARARQEKVTPESEFEQQQHAFAAENGLYLNLCVHDWPCDEKHSDGLFFTSYVVPLDNSGTFERLARYFNQAKEDFATARYLLAEVQRPSAARQRVSDRTYYADVLEYADYGLTSGMAKTAFALGYNILDKIAVFLKWDLGLPGSERDTTFRNIWHRGKKQTGLRSEILAKNDPNLFALYDIALDLRLNPKYEQLTALRRAITHRHLVVHDWLRMVGEGSSEEEHILLEDLVDQGVRMLRLVKSAMIYLAAYLSWDQDRKSVESEGKLAPLFFYWQHDMRT